MSLKIEISFSISRDRLEKLFELYNWIIEEYKPNCHFDHLVHALAKDMRWRIETLLTRRRFKNMTFSLSEPEAMGFCLLWNGWRITDPLGKVVIDIIFGIIHKQSLKPQFSDTSIQTTWQKRKL